jgi:DNA-binding NtrC family response regulator
VIAPVMGRYASFVLLIDGDPRAIPETAGALSDLDCRIVHALTGEEGMRRYDAERLDVVLVDLSVPGRSGMGVVDSLATRGEVAVVVTGSAAVAAAVEAMQRGASDYWSGRCTRRGCAGSSSRR